MQTQPLGPSQTHMADKHQVVFSSTRSPLEPEEDWDEEIRDEIYQDTLGTYTARKDLNSSLIDGFQNTVNRYPPCIQAFSPVACYDSLVYKKYKNAKEDLKPAGQEEGQFDDADE